MKAVDERETQTATTTTKNKNKQSHKKAGETKSHKERVRAK